MRKGGYSHGPPHPPQTVQLTGRQRRPYPYHGLVSWELLYRLAKLGAELYGPAASRPLAVIPCELVLTINPGTNGRELIVRCRCMAGTVVQPARRYYSYDPLGVVQGLDAAKAMYREHRAAKGSQAV
jgi:hypothetical protein